MFSLRGLSRIDGTGSFATRANRHAGLVGMAKELKALGYNLPDARALRGKHVTALVGHWKKSGVADQTIRNRLSWLRDWAVWIGKPGLLPNSNESFGLAERTPYQGNKARKADPETLNRVSNERVRLALQLEAAFGLRREEVLKARPIVADRGACLELKASWTKGGRARMVPLRHERQRELLERWKELVGDGALIPTGKNYAEFLQVYKYQTRKAGLGQAHGFRHAYAQWRYKVLTGWDCPAAGGKTVDAMTPDEAARDRAVRLQISREMGHGRIAVTETYLGRRFAKKDAA
jgi:integrase